MTTTPITPWRRAARIAAFQSLCQADANPAGVTLIDSFLEEQLTELEARIFAQQLVEGARLHAERIDEMISKTATNWSLHRIALTDRNIIRMAIYEMVYLKTTPAIVIDEAIDIAKTFGTQDSGAFVNGILEKVRSENTPPPGGDIAESVI